MSEEVTEIVIHNKGLPYTILVDTEDLELVSQYTWKMSSGYPIAGIKKEKGWSTIRMHRLILNTAKGKLTDHINCNKLDNRRCNLRECNSAENNRNVQKHKNNSGNYKGAYWYAIREKYRSTIRCNGKSYHLGYFEDEKEAARAYNAKALELFGEYAKLNEIN